MKSLIKWAGGKSGEIEKIKEMIPSFDRYIEPFFGGGALFFDLEPRKAIINDTSSDLISFYKILKNKYKRDLFKREIYNYLEAWERIDEYIKIFGDNFLNLYYEYKNNHLDYEELLLKIDDLLKKKIVNFNGMFKPKFCVSRKNLLNQLKSNLIRKIKRIKEIDKINSFSKEDIKEHIETAFRGGFYIHFRDIMNLSDKEYRDISEEKRIANYYFIREFCYGSMFRFNGEGKFNIPYGGRVYNKKDWRKKVDRLFSNETLNILSKTKIYNEDFESFLKRINLDKHDFIFLDPPYYSEFNEYDQRPFGKEDQKRLSNFLLNVKAKFILIIKENLFILNLYKDKKAIKIKSFDKTYLYNIRGRNTRKTKHLIIYNF